MQLPVLGGLEKRLLRRLPTESLRLDVLLNQQFLMTAAGVGTGTAVADSWFSGKK